MANVLGYLEEIDDTRLVFLGEDPDQPDVFFLGFRNREGIDTKVVVSREAFDALMRLRLRIAIGASDRVSYPHGPVWKHHWVVRVEEIE